MKVGIDSYCYHRFFGEVYPDQDPPDKNMTMGDFLKRAKELDVDGVSLESCFFPSGADQAWFKDLKAQLDEYNFDRVYAWVTPMAWNAARTGKLMMRWLRVFPTPKKLARM
jgi:hypothetical protein